MKKILLGMMAIGMMFATSCEQTIDVVETTNTDGLANVSVNIGLQKIQSRAYSDGKTATELQYAVYRKNDDGTLTMLGEAVDDTDFLLKKEIQFQLVTGHTYAFVFWAASPDAPYTVEFTSTGAEMTVSYEDATANDEARDAFYTYKELKVVSDVEMTAELKRPFAQINVGTDDYKGAKDAGYEPTVSQISVSNTYETLNLVNGEVSNPTDDPVKVEFAYGEIPTDETFPVTSDGVKYEYMAMTYVLVPEDQELIEVSFDCSTAEEDGEVRAAHKVGSVPVQRNYRTNLFGSLLTNDVKVMVEIAPEYETPDYEHEIIADGVEYDKETETFTISNPAGMQWVAFQVNTHGGNKYVKTGSYTYGAQNVSFVGQTVKLTGDIDMTGITWTPIGYETKDSGASIYAFAGTFDGGEYTISNLNVSTEENSNAGLFGATNRATIKDLTLADVNITSHYKTGAIVGDGYNALIENCHVKGGTILVTPWEIKPNVYDDANNVGGIVGYLNGQPVDAWVKNCTVDGLEITAFRKIGGIAGVATTADDANPHTSSVLISDCTVTNTNITADMTQVLYDGFAGRQPEVGTIYGSKSSTGRETLQENQTETTGSVTITVNKAEVTFVNGEEDFSSLLSSGGDAVLSNDVTVSSVAFTEDVNINLAGKTLTVTSGSDIEDVEVVLENGTIEFTQTGNRTSADIKINANGKLTIKDAKIISNAAGIMAQGEGEVLTITNSEFESYNYCVTTNASFSNGQYENGSGAIINLSGSTFTSKNSVAMLNNVPNTFNVDACTFVGNSQAVFMRVGTATFKNTTFHLNSNFTTNPCRMAESLNWGSGNMATIAALVVGNYDTATYENGKLPSYNEPASVTLEGKTNIIVEGARPDLYPAIHVASANNNKVTFNYEKESVTINEYNYTLGSDKIEFATNNIWVNGAEISPNIQ